MKLRPCPGCNNKPDVIPLHKTTAVICSNCSFATEDISDWNNRPMEDELINALEELIEIFPGKNGAGDFSREQRVWSLVKKALSKCKGESNGKA